MIRVLLKGEDHRGIVHDLIDDLFVTDVLAFFGEVVTAKLASESISLDWYRKHFLHPSLDKGVIAHNSGTSLKTIQNKHHTQRKEIVIEEAVKHHEDFVKLVSSLQDDDINIKLALTVRGVTVELDLNESLVVINALAVRRTGMRGGVWSTVGKQLEAPLMVTLCKLYQVSDDHYTRYLANDDSVREVDFYLFPPQGNPARCEVKLMGSGNPEGIDATLARLSDVFVASKLSQVNKKQLDDRRVMWTELQVEDGYLRFMDTLRRLGIPFVELEPGKDHDSLIDEATEAALGI